MKIETNSQLVNISEITIDPVADLNPMMCELEFNSFKETMKDGQNENATISLENGKMMLIDGRNRMKALIQLGIETISADVSTRPMTMREKLDCVKSKEARRHQSVNTKAVSAWKWYQMSKKAGEKINMSESAALYGADNRLMSVVNKLHTKYGRQDIIALLAEGKKINISDDEDMPYMTDSLRTIEKWVKKQASKLITTNTISAIRNDIADMSIEDEAEVINIINHAKKHLNLDGLKILASDLYAYIKEIENA